MLNNWFVIKRFYFSMGGAIAVHTTSSNLIPSLVGLIVIDVVEGTHFCDLFRCMYVPPVDA